MIGEALVIGAQIAFAVGVLFTKKLLGDSHPLLIAALTAVIGSVLLVPLLFYFSSDLKVFTGQKWLWAILAGVFWIGVGEIMYVSGLARTSLSNASLLALTFPLFAVSLAVIFLGETLTLKFVIASLLMIAGYVLLVV